MIGDQYCRCITVMDLRLNTYVLPNTPAKDLKKRVKSIEAYLEAIEHLFAKYLEIRPLFFCLARPMKEEW